MTSPPAPGIRRRLRRIYNRLAAHYGPTGWWPARSAFEIAVGAVLTQNTAWPNVERAIANLRRAHLLRPQAILNADIEDLESALRPSGYFRVKARRLRNLCSFLVREHRGSIRRMARADLGPLREALLAVNGIGPETADDILLYACNKPVFVVDAYTRRILGRHGLAESHLTYEALRAFLERHTNDRYTPYTEFHALLVHTAKDYCKTTPHCAGCPLEPLLPGGGPLNAARN